MDKLIFQGDSVDVIRVIQNDRLTLNWRIYPIIKDILWTLMEPKSCWRATQTQRSAGQYSNPP